SRRNLSFFSLPGRGCRWCFGRGDGTSHPRPQKHHHGEDMVFLATDTNLYAHRLFLHLFLESESLPVAAPLLLPPLLRLRRRYHQINPMLLAIDGIRKLLMMTVTKPDH